MHTPTVLSFLDFQLCVTKMSALHLCCSEARFAGGSCGGAATAVVSGIAYGALGTDVGGTTLVGALNPKPP